MNSDITRLYVEGVQQRHQRKEDAKWQSMQAKYLTEVLEENSYLPDDKDEFDITLTIDGEPYEGIDSSIVSPTFPVPKASLHRIINIINREEIKSTEKVDGLIDDLIKSTGFWPADEKKAKGVKALRHTLYYIFNKQIGDVTEAVKTLENLKNENKRKDIIPLMKSSKPFNLSEQITNHTLADGTKPYELLGPEFYEHLYMAKPTKQPNVGDGEFLLCTFFNLKENNTDKAADLIAHESALLSDDENFTVEVKGTDARMGSSTDGFAYNVKTDKSFVKLIDAGGGEGGKEVQIQQAVVKAQKIAGTIKTEISKLVRNSDQGNWEDGNWEAIFGENGAVAEFSALIDYSNIANSEFNDVYTQDFDTALAKFGARGDWGAQAKYKAKGGAGTVSALLAKAETLRDLLPKIHAGSELDKVSYTASFYGAQIYAWTKWMWEEHKIKVAKGEEDDETFLDRWAEGFLNARNEGDNFPSNMKNGIRDVLKDWLASCRSGECPTDQKYIEGEKPSAYNIETLVAAIQISNYHHVKNWDSVLFMDEYELKTAGVENATFPVMPLHIGKDVESSIPVIYEFLAKNNFSINLVIDEARKDGVQVTYNSQQS
jgi:hypothetical protein